MPEHSDGRRVCVQKGNSYTIELEIVKWAHNPLPALLQDMSIHHGGGDVLVPQKSLNRANVCTPLEKMGGDPVRGD